MWTNYHTFPLSCLYSVQQILSGKHKKKREIKGHTGKGAVERIGRWNMITKGLLKWLYRIASRFGGTYLCRFVAPKIDLSTVLSVYPDSASL